MAVKFSSTELEIMRVFWRAGDLTTPEVHEAVTQIRPVAYTTVKTMIDRLEKKGALERVRQFGRTILYRASIDRKSATGPLFKELFKLFGDSPRTLFSNFLSNDRLTVEDMEYLQSLVEEKRRSLAENHSKTDEDSDALSKRQDEGGAND